MTTPDKKQLRFGILATGNIARQFADGVQSGATHSTITAVASRTQQSADNFAKTYCIPQAHSQYNALLTDPNVDAVYIALPNNMHHEWTIRALNAGKHVLCEKPIAVNAEQAAEMFQVAESQGLLLAEAYMYLTHPLTQSLVDELHAQTIGPVKMVRSSFSFAVGNPDNNSRFSTELAGGALMDIGCYCVTLALLVADTITSPGTYPSQIQCAAHLHPSGVDDYASVSLRFPNDLIASFVCGMSSQMNNISFISGRDGYIEIPIPWKPPMENAVFHIGQNITPKQDQHSDTKPRAVLQNHTTTVSADKPLYALEADAFAAAVFGKQPLFITPDFSLRTIRILDALRSQAGLCF